MDNVTSKLSLVLLASLVVLSGCFGPGSVSGTVSGISLNVQDAIFFSPKDNAGKTVGLAVLLADKPNLCDTLKANRQPKSSTGLSLVMMNIKVDGSTVTFLSPDVASYTVTTNDADLAKGGLFAQGGFGKNDSSCTSTLTDAASTMKSGLVKLTAIKNEAGGTAEGTFDVSIGSQADKLTGRFTASFCDLSKMPANPSCE